MSEVRAESGSNERLIVFSDGVIAITITLLVLDIRLPEFEGPATDAELGQALVGLAPQYVAYVLSFIVIGIFWLGHKSKFEHIVRSSAVLTWLNIIFLLEIGFMPFVTDVLAENRGQLATMLYAATVSVISLTAGAMSYYALRAGLTDLPRHNATRTVWPILAPAMVFAASIPVALLGAHLAQWFWLLLIPAGIVSGRFSRDQNKSTADRNASLPADHHF